MASMAGQENARLANGNASVANGNAPPANRNTSSADGAAPAANMVALACNGNALAANGSGAESTTVAPSTASAPIGKFSGEAGDDYIEWRVRMEALLRSQGIWEASTSASSGANETRARAAATVTAALDAVPLGLVAEAKDNPREIFRLLDDKYIPKRKKATFAERFAANPAHFDNFKRMLDDARASSDDEDSDFIVDEEEEDDESELEEELLPEEDVKMPEDDYVSEEDEDYNVDDSKLVEDELDEDLEEAEVVPE